MGNNLEDLNKSLEEIGKEVSRRSSFTKIRKIYKEIEEKEPEKIAIRKENYNIERRQRESYGMEFKREDEESEKIYDSALAHRLLKSDKYADIETAVSIYLHIGRDKKKIISKATDRLKKLIKEEKYPSGNSEVESFEKLKGKLQSLIKEEKKDKGSQSNLEGRLGIFAILFFGGLVMSAYHMNMTGWVISELTSSTPSLIGIGLLFLGLVGMLFSLRKKRI